MTTSESYTTLRLEREDGLARLTLNRPDKLNALSGTMMEELNDSLEPLSDPEIRAVLITGAGKAFSAGADLSESDQRSRPEELLEGFERLYNPFILGLRELPKPVVAAVNGVAVGYAFAMVLAADISIASQHASFLTAAASAGIMPDGGLTAFLPALAGLNRATSLVLLGERLDAQRALESGLISRVCAPEELGALSTEIAQQLAAGPTKTFAATKAAFNAHIYPRLAEQLRLEGETQFALSTTADYQEGVAAFVQRRPPQFTGN